MGVITHYPLLVVAVAFIVLSLSAWFGAALLRRRRSLDDDQRQDFGVIVAATLTLLGLIIGFSFSMAIDRYDQRKNYEEEEANAIGTEYARADLLPATDATRIRALLVEYLDQRISTYEATGPTPESADARTSQLQADLWSAVQAPAAAQPTPIVALAVSGMNDVLNSQGYTAAADRNRIPTAAWILMGAIAICCNVLLGWSMRSRTGGGRLLVILPFVVAVAFMLIADIDTPRHGIIRVAPENLISLSATLHGR